MQRIPKAEADRRGGQRGDEQEQGLAPGAAREAARELEHVAAVGDQDRGEGAKVQGHVEPDRGLAHAQGRLREDQVALGAHRQELRQPLHERQDREDGGFGERRLLRLDHALRPSAATRGAT